MGKELLTEDTGIIKRVSYVQEHKGKNFIPSEQAVRNRLSREVDNSLIYAPLNGNQGLIDYKAASRVSRIPRTILSTVLPGETTPHRISPTRRAAYGALFGGLPGGRIGGRRGGIGRGIGGGRRNPFRCPPGFERGGSFSNRFLSTCGAQILAVPGGAIDEETRRAAAQGIRDSRKPEGTKPATSVRVAEVHEARLRETQGMVAPNKGRPDADKQNAAIDKTLTAMSKADEKDNLLRRVVRSDGVVLAPLADVDKLAKQRKNPDLDGAAYLEKVSNPTPDTGINELSLLGAGMSQLGFALPENVQVSVAATRKITPREAAALKGRAAQLAKENDHPLGGLVALAGESNLLKIKASADGLDEPYEKVKVQNERGAVRTVPRWVFQVFLAQNAPLRPSGKPHFKLVEEVRPSAEKVDETYLRIESKVANYHALFGQ